MKQRRGIQWVLFLLFALLAVVGGGCGGGSSSHSSSGGESGGGGSTATVEGAIVGVTTLAFVDVDGPKVQAIVVKYDQALTKGSVDTSTYEIFNSAYGLPQITITDAGTDTETKAETLVKATVVTVADSAGDPGAPTKVYVSQTPAIDPAGIGDSSGNFVIIEINTRYQLSGVSSSWRPKLAGGVKQVKAITAGNISVPVSDEVYSNYELVTAAAGGGGGGGGAPGGGGSWGGGGGVSNTTSQTATVTDDSSYVIEGLEGYKIYTDEPGVTISSDNKSKIEIVSNAFRTANNFSETTGTRLPVAVKYNIFVPADYDASKKYALALHINDAGVLGTDPMIALTETNVAVNYAQRGQDIVKGTGVDGLIVVLPQFPTASVSDNWIGNEYVQAVWQLLDNLTANYSIDMDRIYGSGQSMGGMQVLYMASQRDNYFAGIWAIGSQWANNYDKATIPFAGRGSSGTFHTFPYDGHFITNPDWENWYWSLSDDNILVTNMSGDGFATTLWNIFKEYYEVKGGGTIPYRLWDSMAVSRADQNVLLRALLAETPARGIYWNALAGGDHMATWIYAHAISASYDWLLKQTKLSEDNRGKLSGLASKYVDDGAGSGTYCLSTGTAANGPSLKEKEGLDYQPQLAVSCGGSWPPPPFPQP